MRPRMRRLTKGVALLEVLVSVAIISAGVLVPMRTIGLGSRVQSRQEDRNEARRLAERRLVLLRQAVPSPVQEEMGGVFEPPFAQYSWSAKTYPPSGLVPFRLVHVTIWKQEDEEPRPVYSLRTLML